MSARSIAAAVCLASTFALGACAKYTYVAPMQPGLPLPRADDSVYPVEIVPDEEDNERCGKNKKSVKVLYGRGNNDGPEGTRLTWRVTNKCKIGTAAKAVRVSIEKVKAKHKLTNGMNPFSASPDSVEIPFEETRDIYATVRAKPSDDDYKGFNVYTYTIKVEIVGGKTSKDDPEIIIDWP